MNKPRQYKTKSISDQEFKILLDQTCDKYDEALKELAKGPYCVASDKEVKSKYAELDKRYKGLYDDLAET